MKQIICSLFVLNHGSQKHLQTKKYERSGSVIECLTRDRGPRVRASPASLHCVLEQDILIIA